jgi:uncharacterized membrane protein required for colicin V production
MIRRLDMESLNILDIIIVSFILGGAFWGYRIGALRGIGPAVLIFALVTVSYVYPDWKEYFAREGIVSFFLVILLIFIGIWIWGVLARYFTASIGSTGIGNLNWILGLLLGIILGAVLAGFLVFVLKTYGGADAREIIKSSFFSESCLKFWYIIMEFIQKSLPISKKVHWWERFFKP